MAAIGPRFFPAANRLQYHLRVRLVLASRSPRRVDLLTAAGIPFTVQSVDADETPRETEQPDAYVRRIALAKCAAAGTPGPDTVILAADTTVTVDGLLLGKPRDDRDAATMLARLSGRTHRVLTAIVLAHAAGRVEDLAVTNVVFHPLSPEMISWYLASGEPRDKAGAYGIQGLASRFIARLDGSYTNVVGLPVDLVCRHLETIAPALLASAEGSPQAPIEALPRNAS
jgi:septum formation protein